MLVVVQRCVFMCVSDLKFEGGTVVYCQNKIVILAAKHLVSYCSCVTILTMQFYGWKLRIHAVVTDTSLPQMFYKDHIL